MTLEERPTKRDAFMAFYGEGWVSVHLDARREAVEVPEEFASNRHLVLQYGRDMPIPIPDLEVGEDGIRATLSFARTPHRTFVPWSAVYIVACNDGRGILYYEDVPGDVSLLTRPVDAQTGEPLDGGQGQGPGDEAAHDHDEHDDDDEEAAATAARPAGRRERILKSVPAAPVEDQPAAEADLAPAAARRRRRPQLKVVK